MSTSIRQEIFFGATPERVYEALMNSDKHSEFTGGSADISPEEGGKFSCHDGQIVGRNIELTPNQRIVQAWRVSAWEDGAYSLIRIELEAQGDGTRLVLEHLGVDEQQAEHLGQGWEARYWIPLREYLSRG